MMSLHDEIRAIGVAAKAAARELVRFSGDSRNEALLAMAEAIDASRAEIAAANAVDVAAAAAAGLSPALIDRLTLTEARVDGVIKGLREVAALPDPLVRNLGTVVRPNGLEIVKQPVPIGVIAIIFESRPNVTADAAALCVKSGNAVILRGGKEALNSNKAIAAAMAAGIRKAGDDIRLVAAEEVGDADKLEEMVAVGNSLVFIFGEEVLVGADGDTDVLLTADIDDLLGIFARELFVIEVRGHMVLTRAVAAEDAEFKTLGADLFRFFDDIIEFEASVGRSHEPNRIVHRSTSFVRVGKRVFAENRINHFTKSQSQCAMSN